MKHLILRMLGVVTNDDLGYVSPWNPVIADKHAATTERMLLGKAEPSTVVGNRVTEAILADRDRRCEELRRRGTPRNFTLLHRKTTV